MIFQKKEKEKEKTFFLSREGGESIIYSDTRLHSTVPFIFFAATCTLALVSDAAAGNHVDL